jgi:acetylornithine deacetylase/succinyl-diaminopimelate desuccinylase-like protein
MREAVSLLLRMEYRAIHERYLAAGLTQQFGSIIAAPGIAEKGYIDVLVEVTAPGGHSSIPPAHTVLIIFFRLHDSP